MWLLLAVALISLLYGSSDAAIGEPVEGRRATKQRPISEFDPARYEKDPGEAPSPAKRHLAQLEPFSQYDLVLFLGECKVLFVGLNKDATSGPLVNDGAPLLWLCRRVAGRKAECTFVDMKSGAIMAAESYRVAYEGGSELFLDAANGATKLLTHSTAAVMSSIVGLDHNEQGGTGLATKSCTGLKLTGDEAQALLRSTDRP
jgi:hypothetical protein